MNRQSFERMLEIALEELANDILHPGSPRATSFSASTEKLRSQLVTTKAQRHSAELIASASHVNEGQKIALRSSADIPPCF